MSKWSLPIDQLVTKAKGDIDKVVRKVTLDLFTRVVERSPVDTGRFRANWNVSYGTPDYSTTDSTAQGRGTSEATKAATLPVGGIAYLCNGLPYARRLEHGYSKQAPSGMVKLTVAEFPGVVQEAVR